MMLTFSHTGLIFNIFKATIGTSTISYKGGRIL